MYYLLIKLSPILIITIVIMNKSPVSALCSLNDMRRYAKTVCEGVVRQRRSIHHNSAFQLDNYHVTLVKDHPKRDTLFPELHPRAKIVTGDPPFPENGFLVIMDSYKSHSTPKITTTAAHNVHNSSSRKKHRQMFNEIHKKRSHYDFDEDESFEEERPRLKRQPNHGINNVNYCCAMPKDVKLCKSLLCGHYD
uniref:CSON010107 protein n=1 Tax=Culicoides sonorensis TaxID=179676 RepID=A0A336LP40_CULSO